MKNKITIPKGKYVSAVHINENDVTAEFGDKKKIALVFVCVNAPYWPYLKNVLDDVEKHFLKNHTVDVHVWTDMPDELKATKYEIEPIQWPMPTLMRYHLFLQQEEKLKEYDYIYYLDADMKIVDGINEEILGDGLLVAEHPMYALKRNYVPPYEPNPDSTAYIKRVAILLDENGKPRLKPLYAAGGFQGGEAKAFIEAMKTMKKNIDQDFNRNYVAIWNDESHWNRYLYDYKGPLKVLSPSYIYPDSLIKEYYEPLWGCSYVPKIVTLTKPFSTSKEGGDAVRKMLGLPDLPPGALPREGIAMTCPTCGDILKLDGHDIIKIVKCEGKNVPHQVEMNKHV